MPGEVDQAVLWRGLMQDEVTQGALWFIAKLYVPDAEYVWTFSCH
jgi:hypothetical protein